jgi:hypothetical protein
LCLLMSLSNSISLFLSLSLFITFSIFSYVLFSQPERQPERLPACLLVCCLSLSVSISIYLCVSFSLSESLSICLSACLYFSIYLSIYLYVRLSFYASSSSLSFPQLHMEAPLMRTWYSAIHPGRRSCSKSQSTPSRLSLTYALPPVAAISSPTMQLRRSQRSCPNLISINLR